MGRGPIAGTWPSVIQRLTQKCAWRSNRRTIATSSTTLNTNNAPGVEIAWSWPSVIQRLVQKCASRTDRGTMAISDTTFSTEMRLPDRSRGHGNHSYSVQYRNARGGQILGRGTVAGRSPSVTQRFAQKCAGRGDRRATVISCIKLNTDLQLAGPSRDHGGR